MKYNYNVIVIGGGSAGLSVASGCAAFGAKTALIEENKMGGDCLNTGCVPSKAFLKSAHLVKKLKESERFAIGAGVESLDIEKVLSRVQAVVDSVAPADSVDRYESMGVNVFSERGRLLDPHTVEVGGKKITGKYIVIATGSAPMIPPIKGLKDIEYLTNENIFSIKKLPEHLIVLGAGPIGLELGQGFAHLGSKVSIIDMLPGLFTKDDPEVGPLMEEVFKEDNMIFHLNSKIKEIKKRGESLSVIIEKDNDEIELKGDGILVSLGRAPVSKNLGLEEVGVIKDNRGYVEVDKTLRTNIKNIYACGDIAGPYQFTHMAGYQAGIIIKNIIMPLKSKVDYSFVPWTTYTMPEVAHVGYTEPWAAAEGIYKEKVVIPLKDNDRAKTEGEKRGFLKLILGRKNRLIGATIVAEKAGEMIPLAAMAIKNKMKATAFADIIFAYPSESDIYKSASYDLLKKKLTPGRKKIIQKLFLR